MAAARGAASGSGWKMLTLNGKVITAQIVNLGSEMESNGG